MIALAPGTRVYLACRPVSMQKGFDGLTALASQILGADPYSGHLFLFRGKRGDYFKALYWDCLLYTSPSPRDRTRSRMPSSA